MLKYFLFLILLASCTIEPSLEGVEALNDKKVVDRGAKLVNGLAACGYCHSALGTPNSPLGGGKLFHDVYGDVRASNITPSDSGIGNWSVLQVMQSIRASNSRGRELSPDAHSGYSWLSDSDTIAIVSYLKQQSAVVNPVEKRVVSFIERNTKGFFYSSINDVGYVPDLEQKEEPYYGAYLVDHVARCIRCHNAPASTFKGEEYLAGGKKIEFAEESRVAPAINASESNGLGKWNEQDIVTYLKTGRTMNGDKIDSKFCPTSFYRNASELELGAVAKYLKSLK